jgi:hypothetical protein
MPEETGRKNKLFKGLTDYDILVWEEEKMRHQRKVGKKVTDVDFLRFLLMAASRPVISAKEGVASAFLVGQGPIYEKADVFLERVQSKTPSQSAVAVEKVGGTTEQLHPECIVKQDTGSSGPEGADFKT